MSSGRQFVFVAVISLFSMPSHAATVQHGGVTYTVVDWITIDPPGNIATGTAGVVGVTFQPCALQGTETPFIGDYSTDSAFDAITYDSSGMFESVSIQGHGNPACDLQDDVLSFSPQVSSVLMLIGFPGSDATGDEYGTSDWDFDDNLNVSVIDSEVINETTALQVLAGNMLVNPVTPIAGNHASGIVRIDGSLGALTWTHVGSGTDSLKITFAIAPAVVPVPAAAWLFGAALGLLGGLQRRSA